MMEIEVKAKQPKDIEAKLKKLKAKYKKKSVEKNTVYNSKFRDFVQTGELVRVRETGKKIVLTYKNVEFVNGIKQADEHECVVDNGIYILLKKLGLFPEVSYEKERKTYELHGCKIELDDVKGLGKFIEVEIKSNTPESARDRLEGVMADLGITEKDRIRATYPEMAREKKDVWK